MNLSFKKERSLPKSIRMLNVNGGSSFLIARVRLLKDKTAFFKHAMNTSLKVMSFKVNNCIHFT